MSRWIADGRFTALCVALFVLALCVGVVAELLT
jgi:hypothetical protein